MRYKEIADHIIKTMADNKPYSVEQLRQVIPAKPDYIRRHAHILASQDKIKRIGYGVYQNAVQ